MGTSANDVRIQIWTALIAILVLKFLQMRSRLKWSLSNLVALLRLNLFVHRDLCAWIDEPYQRRSDHLGLHFALQTLFHCFAIGSQGFCSCKCKFLFLHR